VGRRAEPLRPKRQPTIIGRHGGFADKVRPHWSWSSPLPEALDPSSAGPLMCGGGTAFLPFVIHGIKPTDRVGVVGIGGLAPGSEVRTCLGLRGDGLYFDTLQAGRSAAAGRTPYRVERDVKALKAITGTLDFLLVTAGASLEWDALMSTAAKGRSAHCAAPGLHRSTAAGCCMAAQHLSVTHAVAFRAVHHAELCRPPRHCATGGAFPTSRVNDALDHLRAGKARHRVVLDADWA